MGNMFLHATVWSDLTGKKKGYGRGKLWNEGSIDHFILLNKVSVRQEQSVEA
jgi:hypothetical protein